MNKKGGKKSQPLQNKKVTRKIDNNKIDKWVWFALAVVVITTFAIYFKAISFDLLFTWDDQKYITDNDNIKALHWANINLFFTKFYFANYQPVTLLLYAIEYKMGAGSASIFHFNNILLHIINTCLVFVLIRKISPKNTIVALVTAAFFAVHPMHVESVAWVSELKDVLYSFFFLIALILYTNYLKSQKTKLLIYAAVLFVLSCLSKSAAVVFPLIMLLLDFYSNRKFNWKMLFEKVPFFIISLIFGIAAIFSQSSSGAIQDMAPKMSVMEHISMVSFSFISYLFKAFIPLYQSAVYPYPNELGSTLPIIYYLSILCVGLVICFVWYSLRWGRDVLFGFAFFVVTIILVLQFIPIGAASMADRYTYIPYIGVFFIVGKLFEYLTAVVNNNSKQYKKYIWVAFILAFISFSTISYGRVKLWENDETLFSDAIETYPNCSIAYLGRGAYYNSYFAKIKYANDPVKSKMYIKKAIKDYESSIKYELIPKNNWRAYNNLGIAKGNIGDTLGAIKDFDKSIELNADNRFSYLYRGTDFLNYCADKVYANDKTKKEMYIKLAIEDFENSLKYTIIPAEKVQAFNNIEVAKTQLGDYKGAICYFDSLIMIDSQNIEVYRKRSDAKFNLKDYKGALDDCYKIIERNPNDAKAIKNRDIVKSILENAKPGNEYERQK